MLRNAGIPAALCLLVAGVFAQVRNHAFVHYDDDYYILDNAVLKQGLSAETAWHWLITPFATNWTPLSSLSMQLDFELYGLEPRGWLLTNVALHAASTLLLFLALRRLTASTWRSAFCAALFGVHPLHVESVAWASERKDVLAGLCFMLGLVGYSRYAERPGAARYLAVAGAQALGLLAKPTLVTLPCVLLLLDFWPLGRWQRLGARRVALEKLPLFALVAAASAVTYWVQQDQGAMPLHAPPLFERAQNAVDSYTAYLFQSFWPTRLACFYPYPRDAGGALDLTARLGLLGGISAVALVCTRTRGYLFVGWFWFLGMLVPMLGLVQVGLQARADRYTYLPQIGLAVAVVWGVCDLVAGRARAQRVAAGLAAAALLLLAFVAQRQVGVWRDTLSLFTHAAHVTEGNYLAWKVIGDEHVRAGRSSEAEAAYQRSIELKADYSLSHFEYATLLREQGRAEQALRHLRWVAKSDPEHERVFGALGSLLVEQGEFEAALPPLRRALAQKRAAEPALRAMLLGYLATAEVGRGAIATAAGHYRASLAADPEYSPSALNLALLIAGDPSLGSPDEASALVQGALLRARGDSRQIRLVLAMVEAAAGRRERALEAAEAVALESDAAADAELAARARELVQQLAREPRRTPERKPAPR